MKMLFVILSIILFSNCNYAYNQIKTNEFPLAKKGYVIEGNYKNYIIEKNRVHPTPESECVLYTIKNSWLGGAAVVNEYKLPKMKELVILGEPSTVPKPWNPKDWLMVSVDDKIGIIQKNNVFAELEPEKREEALWNDYICTVIGVRGDWSCFVEIDTAYYRLLNMVENWQNKRESIINIPDNSGIVIEINKPWIPLSQDERGFVAMRKSIFTARFEKEVILPLQDTISQIKDIYENRKYETKNGYIYYPLILRAKKFINLAKMDKLDTLFQKDVKFMEDFIISTVNEDPIKEIANILEIDVDRIIDFSPYQDKDSSQYIAVGYLTDTSIYPNYKIVNLKKESDKYFIAWDDKDYELYRGVNSWIDFDVVDIDFDGFHELDIARSSSGVTGMAGSCDHSFYIPSKNEVYKSEVYYDYNNRLHPVKIEHSSNLKNSKNTIFKKPTVPVIGPVSLADTAEEHWVKENLCKKEGRIKTHIYQGTREEFEKSHGSTSAETTYKDLQYVSYYKGGVFCYNPQDKTFFVVYVPDDRYDWITKLEVRDGKILMGIRIDLAQSTEEEWLIFDPETLTLSKKR